MMPRVYRATIFQGALRVSAELERGIYAASLTELSGLFHKYTHVRCAAFEPGRGATKEHSRKHYATEEQQSPGSNAAQPAGRQFFSPQPSWLAPHRPLAGMLVACASVGAKIPCRERVRIYEIDH
jgi:hypothetical protein